MCPEAGKQKRDGEWCTAPLQDGERLDLATLLRPRPEPTAASTTVCSTVRDEIYSSTTLIFVFSILGSGFLDQQLAMSLLLWARGGFVKSIIENSNQIR